MGYKGSPVRVEIVIVRGVLKDLPRTAYIDIRPRVYMRGLSGYD